MRQVLQSLSDGTTTVEEVPCPSVGPGRLLIRTQRTLVSAGTERMLVEFGRGSLLSKARQQPEKVRQVLDKIRTDGLMTTLDAVRGKLDMPISLGYCNAGEVLEVGAGVDGIRPGDRVVSNGPHAEVVCVPRNLCARIPEGVCHEHAAFTVLSAIGLQGLRLAAPTLGECFALTGLGLIGLITAQLLQAQGCRVLGIDPNPARLELAGRMGIETVDLSIGQDPVAAAMDFSRGRGVDGVLITASTKSSEPVHQAAQMCRQRGRIVLVGVTGLELQRSDFYEKELSFQVSCSYGPGRYDEAYEESGHDYPLAYVRWTEQRNFEAVLDMMAEGSLDVSPLISHRFALDQAPAAYGLLGGGGDYLGIVLEYPTSEERPQAELRRPTVTTGTPSPTSTGARVGVIGAGNYACRMLMPSLSKTAARRCVVVDNVGANASYAARKFGFERATSDVREALEADDVDGILIATRHNSHAALVCQALEAGKHVFVEKPLALTTDEVVRIERTHAAASARLGRELVLMVGFNRRFAPHTVRVMELLRAVSEPKVLSITVNAGAISATHWTQSTEVGGGRILGEGCHFIDLLRFMAGAPIESWQAACVGRGAEGVVSDDKAVISLRFADGSLGAVQYIANGHGSFPKERLEVFCAGRVLQIDNFRSLRGYGWPGARKMKLFRQDKGHAACAAAFVDAVARGGPSPIPLAETYEVARVTVSIAHALRADGAGSAREC